jgi:DNA processing protein
MAQDNEQTLHWIGLSSIPGIGRATFRKLVSRFGSPADVLAASPQELRQLEGLSEKAVHGIATFPWRDHAAGEMAKAVSSGVEIITADDNAYPENLRTTPDAPLFLYQKGRTSPEDRVAIAIVGTRTPTHYGLTTTHRMAYELASAGYTVVSGLARGIDTQAHKGALAAKGRTIAVLGCGIDVAYPAENRDLMERIAESGVVMTENPFGTRPESGYFPARNRIISGLSLGTVIVEASVDSGSLITADYALVQGRRLFAVPGNAGSPMSRGSNRLIKQGAVLVESAEDVLLQLGGSARARRQRPLPPLTPDEEKIFNVLSGEPKHIDAILSASGSTPGMLNGVLTTLELKGLVKQLPGKYFVRDAC